MLMRLKWMFYQQFCRLALTVALSLALQGAVSFSASAGELSRVRVFVELTGNTPALVPLKFALAKDTTGKEFRADAEGWLDLSSAQEAITVSLDSPYFQVHNENDAYTVTIPLDSFNENNKEIIFTEKEAPLEARLLRMHLERAREGILEAAKDLPASPWFHQPVVAKLQNQDKRCNAIWEGEFLFFDLGDTNCESPARLASIVFHEYAHGTLDHLMPEGVVEEDSFKEGFSDAVSALLSKSPRIGEGLWKNRQTTWLRDLSQAKNFLEHARGVYSASLSYSGAIWDIRETLALHLGSESEAEKLVLHLLLSSISNIRSSKPGQQLKAAAMAFIEAIANDTDAREIQGMTCIAKRAFSEHGLLPSPKSNCMSTTLGISSAPAEIEIHNDGKIATGTLTVNAGKFTIPAPSLSPGQSAKIQIPSQLLSKQCGEPTSRDVWVKEASGDFLSRAKALFFAGDVASTREVVINLLETSNSAHPSIPDGLPQAAGGWLEFPFQVKLNANEKVISAGLEFETDHPYSDDLLFAWTDANGQVHEFFKGEVEIPLPPSMSLSNAYEIGLSGDGFSTIAVRDLKASSTGTVKSAKLRLKITAFNCN